MSGSAFHTGGYSDCMAKCVERYAKAVKVSGVRLTAGRRAVISVLCSFEC
jgi:Fe2+ or Zn2+ uptake regulation protein